MATDQRQGFMSAGTPSAPGEIAAQAKDQAVQATDKIKSTASSRVRSELNTRSTQAADQITPYLEALHRAGHHLETQGSTTGGKAVNRVADQVQQFSDYLRQSDADTFLGDIESFARRRPWAAGGLGLALGFMGARFLKASSETRYSTNYSTGYSTPYGSTGYPPTGDTSPQDMPLTRETDETTVGGW